MATNEFTNLLTDHILSKTPGGTILIDSPVNITQPIVIDTTSIKTDNINPHTTGGNINVNTNLNITPPNFLNTNGIQSLNAQPIGVNFGLDVNGIVKSDLYSSHTINAPSVFLSDVELLANRVLSTDQIDSAGALEVTFIKPISTSSVLTDSLLSNTVNPIDVNSDLKLSNTSTLRTDFITTSSTAQVLCNTNFRVANPFLFSTDTLTRTTPGSNITVGAPIAMGNNAIKYGASNTSEIYELASQNYFKTPSGATFTPFIKDYISVGFSVENGTVRTLASNTLWYIPDIPTTGYTNLGSNNYSVFATSPNAFGFQYNGTKNRLARLNFVFSIYQNIGAGNPIMNLAIAKNPVINAVTGAIDTLSVITQTRQKCNFTSASVNNNITLTYLGPVVPGDRFFPAVNHSSNGATCVMSFGTFICENMSIGTD